MPQNICNRRTVLAGAAALPFLAGRITASAQATGGLLAVDADKAFALFDAVSGSRLFTFAIEGAPSAAWATSAPGVAIAQTSNSLAVLNLIDGSAAAVSLPASVAGQILPSSIQFRGSAGYQRMLIGTANMDANTFVLDLDTGERTSVIGLLQAETDPVSLPNVAISSDDSSLLAWDGRSTWIVDLDVRASRVLGSQPFTFSAGFSPDGQQIAYSQQLQSGATQLCLQSAAGFDDQVLFESESILVALWTPDGRMLLDDRTDDGGTMSLFDPMSGDRADLLDYAGATNIVQFNQNGSCALVGIEGAAGRDWYLLQMSKAVPTATLLTALQDTAVVPGFAFHADWAVATRTVNDTRPGSILSVRLADGLTTTLISDIDTDAEVTTPVVAPNGPGAVVGIDSFTELSTHFLQLEDATDTPIEMMKGGHAVIAPDASGFAVSFGLNTGGTATIIYDQQGNELATVQADALAWV